LQHHRPSAAASASAAAAATADASAGRVLYEYALSIVFRFLRLRELIAALCVSKQWCAVVRIKMPCLGLLLSSPQRCGCSVTAAWLGGVVLSPLARHINWLNCSGVLDSAGVATLAQPGWANLLFQKVELHYSCVAPPPHPALAFPPRLRKLRVWLEQQGWGWTVERSGRLLAAVSRITELETLDLMCYGAVRTQLAAFKDTVSPRVLSLLGFRPPPDDDDAEQRG